MTLQPSIWTLYVGMFLCATIIALPVGVIMCVMYFYSDKVARDEKNRHRNYYAFGPDQRNMV